MVLVPQKIVIEIYDVLINNFSFSMLHTRKIECLIYVEMYTQECHVPRKMVHFLQMICHIYLSLCTKCECNKKSLKCCEHFLSYILIRMSQMCCCNLHLDIHICQKCDINIFHFYILSAQFSYYTFCQSP